jgi:hypothetical protein
VLAYAYSHSHSYGYGYSYSHRHSYINAYVNAYGHTYIHTKTYSNTQTSPRSTASPDGTAVVRLTEKIGCLGSRQCRRALANDLNATVIDTEPTD